MPTAEDAQFPSGQFQQVYEVNTEGGRPILFSSMPMEDISINHTGNTLLYHDKKGYEDPWRKHHTSSITRDIWLCSLNGNRTFRKQTAFNGEDRTPVWASLAGSADGKSTLESSDNTAAVRGGTNTGGLVGSLEGATTRPWDSARRKSKRR